MNELNENKTYNEALGEKIKIIRKKSLNRRKRFTKEQLEKPITFWTKKERLLNEIGKELTIILRTKGCSWALGNHGGCSMCGYVQDANINEVPQECIISQFNYAFENKLNEIENENENYVLKIFNSGSFFDEKEITDSTRKYIYEKIREIKNIKEFVVESRIEYINSEKLELMKDYLKNKYIEIGIGLETVDDYIRNNYINKGFKFKSFKETVKLCQENDLGVKAYLLFKPPFVNEQGAIDDCSNSIKSLINLNVNTISINPVNIQRGSLVEYLWYQKRYRPPWFYSLLKCLKDSITQGDLKNIRVLSDPSGAGSKRGIHNCLKKECNSNMMTILRSFMLNQNINELRNDNFQCDCKTKYKFQRKYW